MPSVGKISDLRQYADVAELVDALAWGASEHYARASSTLAIRTIMVFNPLEWIHE